jgi:hypothetical protein
MLTTQGSAFTAYDGTNPPVNPLATQQSKLHARSEEHTSELQSLTS